MALAHIEMRAKNLRDRRDQLDLTQEEVVDRMHDAKRRLYPDQPPDKTTAQMLSDWERAVNEPTALKLELLAVALETDVPSLSNPPADKSRGTPDPFASSEANGQPAPDAPDSEKLDYLMLQQTRLLAEIGRVQGELRSLQGTRQPLDSRTEATGSD